MDQWKTVATVPMPEWMNGLSDDEIQEVESYIERECMEALEMLFAEA